MFYTYNQNNSGGSFVYDADKGISNYVIVEAQSAEEANHRAEQIGLYFDGAGDCPCCGDRWSEAWTTDGSEIAEVYGESVLTYRPTIDWNPGFPHTFIHMTDGKIIPISNS